MARFHQSIKAGALFPQAARTSFVSVTLSRYNGMRDRMKRKGLPPLPFSLDEFRTDLLSVMGGKEDGPIQCRYCKGWFTIEEIAADHAIPLSRNGSTELSNMDYPCAADNNRKGGMTIEEYTGLLEFLDTKNPLMRKDVLSRLQKATALAAGARRAQMLQAQLKEKTAPKPQEEEKPF